jgi:hypothetical protein
MKTAIVYVMFEEYDFLEREIELLNGQTCRDFTLVCVAGQTARPERLGPLLAKAAFPTVALIRREDNGPSGGFYDGQCWCLEQGFDVIVHVESDCFPVGTGVMQAIISEAATHAVVIPLCLPERLAMGWRFCAVRAEALRQAGLSYRCLYFITEDVYFVRTVSRAFPPRVLQDINVYHAPVIAKHKTFDKFLSPFPYLMSRNHMLYNFRLIRQYRARADIVNMLGYIVSLILHALHLAVRGKRRSAALLARGLWDGLLDREDVVVKERMEDRPDDYTVERVESFPAEMVFDKETNVAPSDAVRVFGTMGRRVLVKRVSMFFLFVAYYLSASMALTDGETTWRVKQRAREGVLGRIAFWVVLPIALLAAPLMLLFGLAIRRGPAIELPRPSGLRPVEFPAGIG